MPERNPHARGLTREAARLAGRLAALLDTVAGMSAPASDGRDFLRGMAEAHATAPTPAEAEPSHLDRLCATLGLTSVERDLVVLAGLPDEHEGYAGVLRNLHPRAEPGATAGLAAQLLAAGGLARHELRELLTAGRAVAFGLLRVQDDAEPLFERTLRLPDALWAALGGIDAAPAVLDRATATGLAGLRDWLAEPAVDRAVRALRGGEPLTVLIRDDNEDVAFERGLALVAAAGRPAFGVRAFAGVDLGTEQAIALHALARRAVAVVRVAPRDGAPAVAPVRRGLDAHPDSVVLGLRAGGPAPPPSQRPVLGLACERLAAGARRDMWRTTLPELSRWAPELARRHAVEPGAAAAIAADVRRIAALDERAPAPADVADSVRARAGLGVATGVVMRRPSASWDDLVLSPDRMAQLQEALARLEHQALVLDDWGFLASRPGARGVRLLFTGPPGTGKTLAAEVVAGALGADLMVVDLARVVSKWIGETEKNLADVFEVAERSQAVLLFDEADALFGKRTEVSDAHDRYANLETAYLLQRLERLEGMAILATNLRHNIDAAFLRRIEFIVEFDVPAAAERRALWRCHLPPGAPLDDDVDLDELAALYPVVGAVVRNAAVAAGFLAARDGSPISREHLISAVRREYDKQGRPFPGRPGSSTADRAPVVAANGGGPSWHH